MQVHSSSAGAVLPAVPAWQGKQDLYQGVYRPFTIGWFAALHASPKKAQLLAEAGPGGLAATLSAFNELFHALVEDCITSDMVIETQRLHDHVLWVGDDKRAAADGSVELSLVAKLQRNVSLGVLEALLCLESARVFAAGTLGLHGRELAETLRRSKQLYTSLAVLHDDQERDRIMQLTGRTSPIEYPVLTFDDIIAGRVRIPADRFVVSETSEKPRLRFVNPPVSPVPVSTPTMRCPAHRDSPHGAGTFNDSLWDLLIEIYSRAGKFINSGD